MKALACSLSMLDCALQVDTDLSGLRIALQYVRSWMALGLAVMPRENGVRAATTVVTSRRRQQDHHQMKREMVEELLCLVRMVETCSLLDSCRSLEGMLQAVYPLIRLPAAAANVMTSGALMREMENARIAWMRPPKESLHFLLIREEK